MMKTSIYLSLLIFYSVAISSCSYNKNEEYREVPPKAYEIKTAEDNLKLGFEIMFLNKS